MAWKSPEPACNDPNSFFTTETDDTERFARAILEAQTLESQTMERQTVETHPEHEPKR